MFDLVEKFDFCKEINDQVQQMMSSYYSVESKRSGKEIKNIEIRDFKPLIIGQERDGTILFTWRFNESLFAKTFVALFDQSSHKSKLVFTQDKLIFIINASINTDQSLLAFSVVEKNNSAGYVSPGDVGDIYKSYIAEISPQNRVFSLNIEWRTYQGVQFIHERPQDSHKISHLLFFHHKESIGLYHIPVAELCDRGYLMSMQPSTQQIVREFLWSYFDQISQRLYYVVLFAQDEEEIDATALLTVVEFKSEGDFAYVLNFPLPILFKMNAMKRQAVYFDNYFSASVGASHFNFDIITTKSGSFYVCYQHCVEETGEEETNEEKPAGTEPSQTSSKDTLCSFPEVNSKSFINYTIICVHGAYKLQCSTSFTSDVYEGKPWILFSLFSDYIIAYLPGSFLHVLDISCEHEPVHNILIRSNTNFLPVIEGWDGPQAPLFSRILQESVLPLHSSLIFENQTQKAYKFEVNQKSLLKLFLYSNAATRLSVLHAAMVHFKDKKGYQKNHRKSLPGLCKYGNH